MFLLRMFRAVKSVIKILILFHYHLINYIHVLVMGVRIIIG